MSPILADGGSHRGLLAWLAAALAASVALHAAASPPRGPGDRARELGTDRSARIDPGAARQQLLRSLLGIGRCSEARPRAAQPTSPQRAALPAECGAYRDRLVRLAACDQLPPAGRQALREAAQQIDASWTILPSEARDHLPDGCRMATSALDEAAAAWACEITPRP